MDTNPMSGTENVAVGGFAMRNTDTASTANVSLGYGSGSNLGTTTSSSYNVLIGGNTNGADNLSNTIQIGYNVQDNTSGRICIGTSTQTAFRCPATCFDVAGFVVSSCMTDSHFDSNT